MTAVEAEAEVENTAAGTPRGHRRRRVWVSVAVVAAVAAAATGIVFVSSVADDAAGAADAGAASGVETATAEVTLGDLTGVTLKAGTLSRLEGPTIVGGLDGTLTELPAPGTQLASRSVLYRVDDTPVLAVEGVLPQWRALELGIADGPDVEQLEQSLVAWGHLKGAANDRFDTRTAAAVRAWQKEVGLARTGALEMGRIQFVTGTFTVGAVSASVGGGTGGGALYTTTRDEPVVTVDLPVGSSLARLDGVVTIDLPTGGSAPGRITGIGAPRETDGGKTVVAVTLSFDDPAAAGDLSNAGVQVGFVSEVRQGVLSVPVTALGAASGGGFVVEVVEESAQGASPPPSASPDGSSRLVPVEVGLFAGDRVEISGDVAEGDEVVVPA
jgi:peptidoglycan hydrolase-like protein with peptidoglycan-binding domain